MRARNRFEQSRRTRGRRDLPDVPVPLRVALLVMILAGACTDTRHPITEERIPLQVGSTTVEVVIHTASRPGFTYINLHDDENTAVEAALQVVEVLGGRVIELQHTGRRNVRFELGDSTFAFDPNRIFTPNGLDSTLARQSRPSRAAADVVSAFADSLLEIIGLSELSTVVAVHNNTENGYSALQYADAGPLAADAHSVHLSEGADADDFFFVTSPEVYQDLRAADFNVVMQDNEGVTDDGSLSVLCGRLGIPYVNAEAQHGHLEEQVRMLLLLQRVLSGR